MTNHLSRNTPPNWFLENVTFDDCQPSVLGWDPDLITITNCQLYGSDWLEEVLQLNGISALPTSSYILNADPLGGHSDVEVGAANIGDVIRFTGQYWVSSKFSYNDLDDKPSLPYLTSQLTNDSGFITQAGLVAYNNQITTSLTTALENQFVHSVNGQTGDVSVTAASIGLNYVDNTSDANKPLSIAAVAANTALGARISVLSTTTNDAINNLNQLTNTSITALQQAVARKVDSVNTKTGQVVLNADDIDDSSTTHKFVTQAQLTAISGALQTSAAAAVATSGNWSDLQNAPEIGFGEWDQFTLCDSSQNQLFTAASYSHTGYYFRRELFAFYSVRITIDGSQTPDTAFPGGVPSNQGIYVAGLPYAALDGRWPAQVTVSASGLNEAEWAGVVSGGDNSIIKIVNVNTNNRLAYNQISGASSSQPVTITVTAMYPSRTNVENKYLP